MKWPLPNEALTTILLTAVENITSLCSAMGRTKGLCDAANQLEEIFHGWKFMRYSHERREPQAVAFDRVKLPAVEEQRNLFFSLVVGKAYAS